jgi:hypothetical protein
LRDQIIATALVNRELLSINIANCPSAARPDYSGTERIFSY